MTSSRNDGTASKTRSSSRPEEDCLPQPAWGGAGGGEGRGAGCGQHQFWPCHCFLAGDAGESKNAEFEPGLGGRLWEQVAGAPMGRVCLPRGMLGEEEMCGVWASFIAFPQTSWE